MKKMLTVLAVVLLFGTTGCYTSRRVAGEWSPDGPRQSVPRASPPPAGVNNPPAPPTPQQQTQTR